MTRILAPAAVAWLALSGCGAPVEGVPVTEAGASTTPSGASADSGAAVGDVAAQELARLGFRAAGPATLFETTLPAELTDANYGPKQEACRAAGYDLSAAGGAQVLFSGVEVDRCGMVWIVTRGAEVVCAYGSVGPRSSAAPGIWAIGTCS